MTRTDPHTPGRARRTLAAGLLALSAATLLTSAGTPAGTVIENVAIYEDEENVIPSEAVRTTVRAVCAATLTPPDAARDLRVGENVTLPYLLSNDGNAPFTFPVSLTTSGAQATFTVDGRPSVTSVTLQPDEQARVNLTVSTDRSGPASVTLRSGCANDLSATLRLNGQIGTPLITKTVNGPLTAEAGGTVEYLITVKNPERVPMTDIRIEDVLSAGLEFTELDGAAPVTVRPAPEGRTLVQWTTSLPAGGSSAFTLRARVRGDVSDDTEISNTATATGEGGSAHSTPPATVRVFSTRLLIQKTVTPDSIDMGGLVTYTVTVTNPSATAVHQTYILDTGDTRLETQIGSFTLHGQPTTAQRDPSKPNVIRVNIGTIPAGASAAITYKARVPLDIPETPILNEVQGFARGMQGTIIADVKSNTSRIQITPRRRLNSSGNDVIGRVYVDRDGNHQYSADVDTPVRGARLLMAGGREVVTDESGLYAFSNVAPGTVAVRLDTRSVPYRPQSGEDTGNGNTWTPGTAVAKANALTVLDFPLLPNEATSRTRLSVRTRNATVTFSSATGNYAFVAVNNATRPTCLTIGTQHVRLDAQQTLASVGAAPIASGQPLPTTEEVTCR